MPRNRLVASDRELAVEGAFREAIGGVRAEQVADPAEEAARADPEAWRDDQPEETPQKCAVVDLADAGDEERENRSSTGLRHGFFSLLTEGRLATGSRTDFWLCSIERGSTAERNEEKFSTTKVGSVSLTRRARAATCRVASGAQLR